MTGPAVAALTLSAAALIPVSPRRRLGPAVSVQRRPHHRRLQPPVVAVLAAAGCAVAYVTAVLAAVLSVTTILAAAALTATVGMRRRHRIRRRHAAEEVSALQTTLDILVGELRVGVHPVRAFDLAAAETDQPSVGAGLRTVAARARLGADVPAGLRSVARSSSLPAHWERLAVYWQLAYEHGLAISTLMRAAQRDIVERQRLSARVDAGMAGARASAAILAALPVLGVLLGQLIGAEPLSFLLGGGGALLLTGVLLVCAGLVWSDRITERLL